MAHVMLARWGPVNCAATIFSPANKVPMPGMTVSFSCRRVFGAE
jgi:hypothetical protein